MARHTKNFKAKNKGIAIVGDGLCEKLYFDQMKAHEKLTTQIKPELPNSGSWKTVFDKVEELLEKEYDLIYCIIDYDTVLSQNALADYNVRKAKLINTEKVKIYECNPCFEIWYLLHYEPTTRPFENCDAVFPKLKKHISDYQKTIKYYQNKQIYSFLKENQQKAIANAERLEKDRKDFSKNYPRAEMYKLISELLDSKLQ